MVYIYVLQLVENKFYIGKTSNPEFRIGNHFDKKGALWTTKYMPIHILELIDKCDDFDEDKFTFKYMQQYGIENVRGGSFCSYELEQNEINVINKIITSCSDSCYNCNSPNHFANKCKEPKKQINAIEIVYKIKCTRCKRFGHIRSDCFATTSLKGNKLKTRK